MYASALGSQNDIDEGVTLLDWRRSVRGRRGALQRDAFSFATKGFASSSPRRSELDAFSFATKGFASRFPRRRERGELMFGAVAGPAGGRPDGLPFGDSLIAPSGADRVQRVKAFSAR